MGIHTELSQDGHIVTVSLNRPPNNFLDQPFLEELLGDLRQASELPSCRVIILTHVGKCFSAGANFQAVDGEIDIEAVRHFYATVTQLFALGKPMIAAVNGPAIGAGLGLSLVADFRVAGPGARFSANFVRLGIHPGFAVDFLLPRLVGQQAANSLLYTGRRIGAGEALSIGLVDSLAEDVSVLDQARELAVEIAKSAPKAVADLHYTLRKDLADKVRSALDRSIASQSESFRSKDFREGVAAAAERRDPVFTGD